MRRKDWRGENRKVPSNVKGAYKFMIIKPLKLSGTYEISFMAHKDDRGYFMRTYDEAIFRSHNLQTSWVQESESLSIRKGVIRGLHFQWPPHAETKLVRVIKGAIFDVFVDLREDSETYGKWDSIELSDFSQNGVYISKGFAHGFCTLVEDTIISYKMDSYHFPKSACGIRWDDKTLMIPWPTDNPHLSNRDLQWGTLNDLKYPLTSN